MNKEAEKHRRPKVKFTQSYYAEGGLRIMAFSPEEAKRLKELGMKPVPSHAPKIENKLEIFPKEAEKHYRPDVNFIQSYCYEEGGLRIMAFSPEEAKRLEELGMQPAPSHAPKIENKLETFPKAFQKEKGL